MQFIIILCVPGLCLPGLRMLSLIALVVEPILFATHHSTTCDRFTLCDRRIYNPELHDSESHDPKLRSPGKPDLRACNVGMHDLGNARSQECAISDFLIKAMRDSGDAVMR